MIRETKTKGKAKDSTENIPDSDVSNDPDIDYLISCIPTEVFSEADNEVVVIVREVGSATNDNRVSDVLSHDDIGSAVASLFQQNDESVAIAQADEEHAANKNEEPIPNALDGIDGVVVTETPEVMDTVTVVTEAVTSFDYNDVVVMLAAMQSKSKTSQTWNKRDTNDLHDIIMRKEVCG